MLKYSTSKTRLSPISTNNLHADQNRARASPSGIFPKRASDSPNFSASPTTFGVNFGGNFDPENSEKQIFKNDKNSSFRTIFPENITEINSSRFVFFESSNPNGYFPAEISLVPTEFSANRQTSSKDGPRTLQALPNYPRIRPKVVVESTHPGYPRFPSPKCFRGSSASCNFLRKCVCGPRQLVQAVHKYHLDSQGAQAPW